MTTCHQILYLHPQLPQHKMTQQSILNRTTGAWGNATQFGCPHGSFRVVSKNVSTIDMYALDMIAITMELKTMEASMFLAQETKTAWTPTTLQAIESQCHQVYYHKKIATSLSKEKSNGQYQLGRTLMLALDNWASCIIVQGHDKLLGCWSYLELVGQNNKHIIIILAYRVCIQPFDATSLTVVAQQMQLLQLQGIQKLNPRNQFIDDLIMQIRTWTHTRKVILLGMDANEDIDNPRSHITHLFTKTGLINLHNHCFPANHKPATHQRGNNPINIIAGMTLLADALTYAWILPLGMPPLIKGDHHLLGVDFIAIILFRNTPAQLSNRITCGLNSNHAQHVAKFCKESD